MSAQAWGSNKWMLNSISFSISRLKQIKEKHQKSFSFLSPFQNENKQTVNRLPFLHQTRTVEYKISMEKPLPEKKRKKEKEDKPAKAKRKSKEEKSETFSTCVNISSHLSRGWFHLISSGKICFSYFPFFRWVPETTKLLFLLHLMMFSRKCMCGWVFEVSFISLRNVSRYQRTRTTKKVEAKSSRRETMSTRWQ